MLTHWYQDGLLDRLKVAGQFRYLAKELQLNDPQRQQALLTQGPAPTCSLSSQAAGWVLVEHIKNPALSFGQLASHLQQQRKLPEKLLQHARRLKTALDEQPERVAHFCQSVQLGSLPAEPLEVFPLCCAYGLIQWTLAGESQGEGYGFPFDRPLGHFAKPLRILGQRLEQIKDVHLRGQWRDNIPLLKTPNGPLPIQPQRTNNIMESFFRDFRRGARCKWGHNSISRFLQSMIADTPLVRNLENPNYRKVLLDGQSTLEERFAQIPADTVRKELPEAVNSPEKVPAKIRQLIHMPTFQETICRLFNNAA